MTVKLCDSSPINFEYPADGMQLFRPVAKKTVGPDPRMVIPNLGEESTIRRFFVPATLSHIFFGRAKTTNYIEWIVLRDAKERKTYA